MNRRVSANDDDVDDNDDDDDEDDDLRIVESDRESVRERERERQRASTCMYPRQEDGKRLCDLSLQKQQYEVTDGAEVVGRSLNEQKNEEICALKVFLRER